MQIVPIFSQKTKLYYRTICSSRPARASKSLWLVSCSRTTCRQQLGLQSDNTGSVSLWKEAKTAIRCQVSVLRKHRWPGSTGKKEDGKWSNQRVNEIPGMLSRMPERHTLETPVLSIRLWRWFSGKYMQAGTIWMGLNPLSLNHITVILQIQATLLSRVERSLVIIFRKYKTPFSLGKVPDYEYIKIQKKKEKKKRQTCLIESSKLQSARPFGVLKECCSVGDGLSSGSSFTFGRGERARFFAADGDAA